MKSLNMPFNKHINNIFERIVTRLGRSNDSEIVTASLAAFKLIFIPIATMSDRKSSKEQKKYAITRDFVTESVALAGYIGITGVIKNNLAAPVCAKYYKDKANDLAKAGKLDINSGEYKILSNVDSKALKKYATDVLSDENQKTHMQSLENAIKKVSKSLQNPKDLYLNTRKTISHACVCLLALTVIPFVTNKILELFANKNSKKAGESSFLEDKILKMTYSPPQTLLKPLNMTNYMDFARKGGFNVFNR